MDFARILRKILRLFAGNLHFFVDFLRVRFILRVICANFAGNLRLF